MTCRGRVQNGVVVVEDSVELPEGAEVRIELSVNGADQSTSRDSGETLGQRMMKFAGKAVGLPEDAARNHDHYLYQTPKK